MKNSAYIEPTIRIIAGFLITVAGCLIYARPDMELAGLRREPVEKVTFDLLEEEGGPLIWPKISEQQQDAFDASCRKFYRFLQTGV